MITFNVEHAYATLSMALAPVHSSPIWLYLIVLYVFFVLTLPCCPAVLFLGCQTIMPLHKSYASWSCSVPIALVLFLLIAPWPYCPFPMRHDRGLFVFHVCWLLMCLHFCCANLSLIISGLAVILSPPITHFRYPLVALATPIPLRPLVLSVSVASRTLYGLHSIFASLRERFCSLFIPALLLLSSAQFRCGMIAQCALCQIASLYDRLMGSMQNCPSLWSCVRLPAQLRLLMIVCCALCPIIFPLDTLNDPCILRCGASTTNWRIFSRLLACYHRHPYCVSFGLCRLCTAILLILNLILTHCGGRMTFLHKHNFFAALFLMISVDPCSCAALLPHPSAPVDHSLSAPCLVMAPWIFCVSLVLRIAEPFTGSFGSHGIFSPITFPFAQSVFRLIAFCSLCPFCLPLRHVSRFPRVVLSLFSHYISITYVTLTHLVRPCIRLTLMCIALPRRTVTCCF